MIRPRSALALLVLLGLLTWAVVAAFCGAASDPPIVGGLAHEGVIPSAGPGPAADAARDAVAEALFDEGVTGGDIRYESTSERPGGGRFTAMGVDLSAPIDAFEATLAKRLEAIPGCRFASLPAAGPASAGRRVSISVGATEVVSLELFPMRRRPLVDAPAPRARVAIVIDDVGHGREPVDRLMRISDRFTFAVMPDAPRAGEVAEALHGQGAEVIVHLPMEPLGTPPGFSTRGMLLEGMEPIALRARVAEAVRSVPHARGMNNHMGSLLTTREEPMRVVMEEARRLGIYFLDSRTTPRTVAYRTAVSVGVPAAERDVFLDRSVEPSAIHREIERLKERARARGQAIAIGHPFDETIRALAGAVPRFRSEGLELVPLSSLVRAAAATEAGSLTPESPPATPAHRGE